LFKKVSSSYNFPQLEEEILNFWNNEKIFLKTQDIHKNDPPFVFFEGPPTANGKPHAGHALTRVIKDLFLRYHTMKGFNIVRKGGWDTHGLPVEIEVEKELGISGKQQIEKFGVRKFNELCKNSVMKYERDWRLLTERIGFWLDMDNPYITFKDEYIESVWWILHKFWSNGLLYKGHKVVPYCPRCGTALSSHELALGYEEVDDPSIFVKLPVAGKENTYFLVWTTTPWTLISNVAIALQAEAEYVEIETAGEKLILAKERLVEIEEDYKIVNTIKGKQLAGAEYIPLFQFTRPPLKAYYALVADFVTLEDGTGIVHLAPAFGEEDYTIGKKYNLPMVQLVDLEGKFKPEVTPWQGMFVKDADPLIIKHLKNQNKLYKQTTYKHTYPFCWRCETPLLYYARESWFIKTTQFKKQMLAFNQNINWYPSHIKEGRMRDFLENNVDWALSRDRYWGTPLPIWICTECGNEKCISSKEELISNAISLPDVLDLHKPYMDEVILRCEKCKASMIRTPEVIDCWFDSGAMPFAQWHYPFEHKEEFSKNFPADFISEALDQTRGWFYSLLAISTMLMNKPAFNNVVVIGLVLDKDGQKMSKSKGNVIDPWDVIAVTGADALRWYFYTVSPPWNPRRFFKEAVEESLKKFLGTLWNAYSFLVLYANTDKINPREIDIPVEELSTIDKWLYSRLHQLIIKVREEMDNFDCTKAARAIEEFVIEDLSNWYIRLCRRRFWKTESTKEKLSAYLTLYEVLVNITLLSAPFIPFISESMYRNLVCSLDPSAPESVHLRDFPAPKKELILQELESAMEIIRKLVTLGRAVRSSEKIKIRQPLGIIYIPEKVYSSIKKFPELLDYIKSELNVKEVKFTSTPVKFQKINIGINYGVAGPSLAKSLPKLKEALEGLSPHWLYNQIEQKQDVNIKIADKELILDPSWIKLSFSKLPPYAVAKEQDLFIVFDTTIDEKLKQEGLVREFINKIQNLRKEMALEITERVKVLFTTDYTLLKTAIKEAEDYIAFETLACSLEETPLESGKEYMIDDFKLTVKLEKV